MHIFPKTMPSVLLLASASFDMMKIQRESRFGFVSLSNKVHLGTHCKKKKPQTHVRAISEKAKLNFALAIIIIVTYVPDP